MPKATFWLAAQVPERRGLSLWEEWHSFSRPGLSDIIADRRRKQSQPSPMESFDVFLDSARRRRQTPALCQRGLFPAGIRNPLFLHLYPVNPDSLPPERRDLGFRQPGFLFEPIRRPPRRQLPGGRPLARLPHR